MSGTRGASLTWSREEDEDWAATVEVRLVLRHDAPDGLADEVLAEAHEMVAEAGRPALEVLGPRRNTRARSPPSASARRTVPASTRTA
ncbi:hypothetical protein [Streptomyces alfalfae]|uniref:Uncharacterized protein n=1 Tax=Streptomyces alfalfae TaxID=1642299 RepID=A0A7T4PHA6_9ACTN|nr:hypothetical protein [Streptomyces alfalfae]QQC90024.1 hypothetical protein I8755_17585 [Streptomyces alfalfae]